MNNEGLLQSVTKEILLHLSFCPVAENFKCTHSPPLTPHSVLIGNNFHSQQM